MGQCAEKRVDKLRCLNGPSSDLCSSMNLRFAIVRSITIDTRSCLLSFMFPPPRRFFFRRLVAARQSRKSNSMLVDWAIATSFTVVVRDSDMAESTAVSLFRRVRRRAFVKDLSTKTGGMPYSSSSARSASAAVTPGNIHAHHVMPVEDYPELAFEPTNGVPLCGNCHGCSHTLM